MGALYIFVLVLLTAVAAEEILPIKNIFNIEADNETTTVPAIESQQAEETGREHLAKTMELILFRPYIPELEDVITESPSKNSDNNGIKVKKNTSELAKPDGQSIDTTTAKHVDEHINKRNVDQEYTEDVQYPLKDDDYSAKIDATSQPFARYEITENVVDVPDDRTLAGPVIHNYSPYRNTPLNLGSPKNDTNVETEAADEDNKNTKSRLSILHINAEVEEYPNNRSKITNFFKGVKNYLSGIKTGVVKGINKLFKHGDEAPHGKGFEVSDDSGEEDEEEFVDDVDDFAELHQTIHKGFR